MSAVQELRKPLFLVAIGVILLVVLVESGSSLVIKGKDMAEEGKNLMGELSKAGRAVPGLADALKEDVNAEDLKQLNGQKPPGVGIPYMAWLDGLIVFTVGLMAASFFYGDRIHGRIQGVVSLVVSLVVLIPTILMILGTLVKLMIMLGLFMAAPFGTIAYMAKWGFFDRAGAQVTLGLLMTLKIGFAACLVLAHQRFLQNKGLVLIIITSLLANLIVGFLHNIVPGILVSITDAVAGIVVLVLAVIWAIFLLVFSIISVIKAVV